MRLYLLVTLASAALAVGCVRYRSAPLQPAVLATEFASRRLDDPGLKQFLASHGSSHEVAQGVVQEGVHGSTRSDSLWRPRDLALVALYYNSELDSARAVLAAARAAEISAGQRPLPSAGLNISRAAKADEGKVSVWSSMLTAGLTFELGGKRGIRLATARARTLATALGLENVAWRVALNAEGAAATTAAAERDVISARAERDALTTVLSLLRARYTEGSISVADVARAEADVRSATLSIVQAERTRLDARDSLARAVGLPVERALVPTVQFDSISGCVAIAQMPGVSPDSIRSLALHRRLDVGAALADYVVAEDSVRLEVANRYPDLVLAPGFGWNQGVAQWSLGLNLPTLVINRNLGLLAEAEARRASVAARFEHVQQIAIQDVGAAQLECGGAREQLAASDSVVRNSERQLGLAEAAYRRGETGQTEVSIARLAVVRALRAVQMAQARDAAAGVAIERAVGGWFSGPSLPFDEALISPRRVPTAGYDVGPDTLHDTIHTL